MFKFIYKKRFLFILLFILFLFFLFLLKIPPNKPPNKTPYRVLIVGDDVMGQVPVLHPIYLQYIYPPIAPISAPKRYVQLFFIICIFNCVYISYKDNILFPLEYSSIRNNVFKTLILFKYGVMAEFFYYKEYSAIAVA